MSLTETEIKQKLAWEEANKQIRKIKRSTLTQLNKIYKPIRDKFDVKLGIRLCDSSLEVYTHQDGELVFGADITVYRKWERDPNAERNIELSHGSLGSYEPDSDTNGATLGHLVARTINRWDTLKPIFKEAMEGYEKALPPRN